MSRYMEVICMTGFRRACIYDVYHIYISLTS